MSFNRYPTIGGGSGGVTSVNGFTGVVVLTTTDIAEGTNLYFTNARAVSALSGTLAAYALLAGRAAGQILNGGTAAGESLTLRSTANAAKGFIAFGASSAYDEANTRLGVGTATPAYPVDVVANSTVGINVLTADFVPFIGSNLGGPNQLWLENYRGAKLDISNGSSFLQIWNDTSTVSCQILARHTRHLYLGVDGTSASKSVVIIGAGGQTGDLLQIQLADATVKLSVDISGNLSVPVAARVGSAGTPAASTALDVSSTTGALMMPRMTTTQRNALTPANGMCVYNTTTDKFQGYAAGVWADLN